MGKEVYRETYLASNLNWKQQILQNMQSNHKSRAQQSQTAKTDRNISPESTYQAI